jgi:dTDP-4-dehydrorhamnose 3,5-epimerase-like enzyme
MVKLQIPKILNLDFSKAIPDDRRNQISTQNLCRPEAGPIGPFDWYLRKNHYWTGLHYSIPPAAQAKIVRCIRGAIYDVIVDLRIEYPDISEQFRHRVEC